MKLSSDGLYKLFPDCANDATTGATVAVWSLPDRTPHPNYPNTAQFLEQYGEEIPEPEPPIEPPPGEEG